MIPSMALVFTREFISNWSEDVGLFFVSNPDPPSFPIFVIKKTEGLVFT